MFLTKKEIQAIKKIIDKKATIEITKRIIVSSDFIIATNYFTIIKIKNTKKLNCKTFLLNPDMLLDKDILDIEFLNNNIILIYEDDTQTIPIDFGDEQQAQAFYDIIIEAFEKNIYTPSDDNETVFLFNDITIKGIQVSNKLGIQKLKNKKDVFFGESDDYRINIIIKINKYSYC